MKKIVALSVLLVLLSAAVFAQDDGSGWKIGFAAQLARNFFTAAKASGEYTQEVSTSPSSDWDGTYTGKLGDNIKGSSHLWTFTSAHPWEGARPDNRIILSLSNNGEHHAAYIDAKLDDSWVTSGPTLMGLLNGGAADWYFQGDTGASGAAVVFDAKVGTGRYGGFVPAYEYWNDWIQAGDYNFFGVMTQDGYVQSDNISVVNFLNSPWDAVYAIGATFGGNFRFAVGSTLYRETPSWDSAPTHALMRFSDDKAPLQAGGDNPYASASNVRAAFMLSGRGLGPLAFDLFYGVNGGDNNTAMRDQFAFTTNPTYGYLVSTNTPSGVWENLIGVYLGLNVVENLGLSIGGTFNFLKYETQQVNVAESGTPSYKPVETENPTWVGIDIKINYSGIDKVGINFNNNLSFAGVTGTEWKKPDDKVVYGLDYTPLVSGKYSKETVLGSGIHVTKDIKTNTQNWFAWTAVLGFGYSLTDNLSLNVGILNLLSVRTDEYEETTSSTVAGSTSTTIYNKYVTTNDELRAAISAQYGVGNVTFGLGLVFQLDVTAVDREDKVSRGSFSHEETLKASLSELKFGIPIFFKVSI